MKSLRALASPLLTFNDAMALLNRVFQTVIPLIPLPVSWGASLRRLWETPLGGDLPEPDQPLPWVIEVAEPWQPFTSCDAKFQNITIVVFAEPINESEET